MWSTVSCLTSPPRTRYARLSSGVSDPQAIADAEDRDAGAPHAVGVGVGLGLVVDALVGLLEALAQQLIGRLARGELRLDVLTEHPDRERRSDLAGTVPAHPVADDRQVVPATVVGVDGNRVLVVVPGDSGVAGTGHLDLEDPGDMRALEELVHPPAVTLALRRASICCTPGRQKTRVASHATGLSMEPRGIEPLTCALRTHRSPS